MPGSLSSVRVLSIEQVGSRIEKGGNPLLGSYAGLGLFWVSLGRQVSDVTHLDSLSPIRQALLQRLLCLHGPNWLIVFKQLPTSAVRHIGLVREMLLVLP